MIKIYKKLIPESLEDYERIRIEAGKENYRFTNESKGYMWFEKTVGKTPKKKKVEEMIFYQENLELWKQWTPKLREAYKQFREERFAQHKDFVSYGAEKLLMNKINKYNETISINLMKASSGYKSIVEHEDIINKGRTDLQIQENLDKEARVAKEQQEALQKRQKQDEAIKNSGETPEYWERQALKELQEQYPQRSEEKLQWLLNPRIRTILKREGFL